MIQGRRKDHQRDGQTLQNNGGWNDVESGLGSACALGPRRQMDKLRGQTNETQGTQLKAQRQFQQMWDRGRGLGLSFGRVWQDTFSENTTQWRTGGRKRIETDSWTGGAEK